MLSEQVKNSAPAENVGEQDLWRAIKNRDAIKFPNYVYGVKSTGVYCRFSCPSRKPRLDRIVLFSSASAAKNAGFRACLRCRPDDPESRQEALVAQMRELIDANPDAKLSLRDLGRELESSPFYLQKLFKKYTGVTPKEYVRASRVQKIKQSLKSGESVRRSVYSSGYNTSSWLYADGAGNNTLGMPASAYKAGGEGMEISYLISDSPLGALLVAGTRFGICSVIIGESRDRMIKILRDEFVRALFRQDEIIVDSLGAWTEKIVECIRNRGNLATVDVPLDVMGSAFQHRVWKELRAIPLGEVRSYSEIAVSMGNPKASRAVARACAANPTPLVVPCHRVVRKNGDIGGYRWGVERKKFLLENEGAEQDC